MRICNSSIGSQGVLETQNTNKANAKTVHGDKTLIKSGLCLVLAVYCVGKPRWHNKTAAGQLIKALQA